MLLQKGYYPNVSRKAKGEENEVIIFRTGAAAATLPPLKDRFWPLKLSYFSDHFQTLESYKNTELKVKYNILID